MTFPVLISTTRGTSNDAATTRSVALPAAVASGDLLFARFSCREGAAVTWDNVTAGGWEFLHDTTDGYIRLVAYWKIATGAEAGLSLSITTSVATRSAWHIDRFSSAISVEC